MRGYYWAARVERDDTIKSWIKVYEIQDYLICENADAEQGFEKIAIYTKDDEPTHVARQLDSSVWTRKLGQDEDIEHSTLEVLEGGLYGKVKIIMKRKPASFVPSKKSTPTTRDKSVWSDPRHFAASQSPMPKCCLSSQCFCPCPSLPVSA